MRKNILWLTSWYPNSLEPLSGDFIARHAKSASMLNNITVIHVVKDHLDKTGGKKTIIKNQYPSFPALNSIVGYYKSADGGVFSSFISLIKYFRFQKQLIDNYIRLNGKPDLINVHISFKAGLGALYCKWRYGIKYIVSEQWTIFCPEAKPSFYDQGFVARRFINRIYKNSSRCSAVSRYLAHSLSDKFHVRLPEHIPNVVDINLFYPSIHKHSIFTFVHISVLNYQKSPDEIINSIGMLKQMTTRSFQLIIYGPFIPALADKIKNESLENYIQYRGEVMQDELAAEVRKCHSLLLYSRFETFGCVVIEAFASGLPVIASDIAVMRELVQEEVNGTFAPIDDPRKLAEKMLWMMDNYENFDPELIAKHAKEKYAFDKVAIMFDNLYNEEIT